MSSIEFAIIHTSLTTSGSVMPDFAIVHSLWHVHDHGLLPRKDLVRALAKRPLRNKEYISVPKGLLGFAKPMKLVKHLCVGLSVKSHIPTDASHFLQETIQFISTYHEFSQLDTLTLKTRSLRSDKKRVFLILELVIFEYLSYSITSFLILKTLLETYLVARYYLYLFYGESSSIRCVVTGTLLLGYRCQKTPVFTRP